MLKKLTTNTLYSFLTLLLLSLIFTLAGFLIIDLFKVFAGIVMIVVFGALLCLAYLIGGKLHYSKSIGLVSVVIIPVLIIAALYGLSMVGIPVLSMLIQYPSAIWCEAFDLKLTDYNSPHFVMYYVILVLHYIANALAVFMGAYKKHKDN